MTPEQLRKTRYQAARTVGELFEAQVSRAPGAVALVFGERSLSYAEVNAEANRLARHLRTLGVGPDQVVALCVERSPEMVIGLLAVLKAGGAYLPLDPAYPAERLEYMVRDSAPVLLLTHARTEGVVAGPPVVDLDADAARWAGLPSENLDTALTAEQLAYVIYTSGSTGKPKGVLVEHGQLLAVAAGWEQALDLRPGLVHLQMAGFSFDVFTADVVRALGFGGRLVSCPRELLLDSAGLTDLLRRHGVGFGDFMPAVLGALAAHWERTGSPATLETVVCGGDVWTPASAARLRAVCGPDVRLVNAYGVTEAAVDSTHYVLPADQAALAELAYLPIGRPLPNVRIHLLDDEGHEVPAGEAGEIHIGGAGVARGYLGRPELTADRFVAKAGERLYKTGDLGRLLPDGQLEFLGRNDFQVKIRGFRVELGEIEARLASCPGVRDAVVVARDTADGDKRLVAYYLPGGQDPGIAAVREHLAAALPAHMVPAACVALEAWPLTANGKLDREALPEPGAEAYGRAGHAEPMGPLETALAELWAQVLGTGPVGREDDFFALGGHSLLAMRLVSLLRQALGREVSPTALFAAPTLAAFAALLAPDHQEVLPPIHHVDRDAPLVLSFAQRRLWFLAQWEGASEAYHVPEALELRGELDRDALARALDTLVARHEALRTRLVVEGGEAFQRIDPPDIGFVLRTQDLTGAADEQLAVLQREEAVAPFDLATGPLVRGRLIALAEDRHVLLLTMHHIVSDGWSMDVLTRELGVLYTAFRRGEPDPLPPLPVQYADYAAWQREWLSDEVLAEQGAYWKDALTSAPAVLALPADRPRPAEQDYRGGQLRVEFDADLTAGLNALGRSHGSTLFMTLLAGWALVLSRLSGQAEVVVGTPTANRRRTELEGLIGFFVNTLALRVDFAGEPTVAELLERVRGVSLAALEHQDLPFEQVVELVNPARSLAHAPLFQVLFAWQNHEEGDLVLPGLEVVPLGSPHPVAKFDLTLSLAEQDGRVVGTLDYASALFDAATAERYVGYFRRVLAQLAAQPALSTSDVSLLGGRELLDWNDTSSSPVTASVQEYFEEQAARNPQEVAAVCDGQSLRYSELNAEANRLAHHLRTLGVGPDVLVAVCLERSLDLIVALVAVLKAGAAYVPLDPAYPAERLEYMLRDSAPALLLTQSHLNPPGTVPVLHLDQDVWAGASAENLPLTRKPDHLAYVLYTSGSTGRPKGVAQTWRTLDNLIHWQRGTATPIRVLQFASISFDVSVQEIWSTLTQGSTLVLLGESRYKELGALRRFIADEEIQRAFMPAAVLQQIAVLGDAESPRLGCEIITAGEALQVTDELRACLIELGGERLQNQYGPTETHVVSQHTLTCAEVADWPSLPPIGTPIPNTRLYVLDARLRPVPVGVVGELYIGGVSLARGYLGRPGLTAERFLPDPFAGPGERMYRSGDLARRLPDGAVGFAGRADDQIKLRGFRVELGEVETVLRQADGVREAAVLLREDVPGDRHLVAYIGAEADVDAVREQLRLRLPEHMVPTRWVSLERLPLTVNGKLDRRALPAPGEVAGDAAYEAPRTETEVRMAEIWGEILHRDRVGVRDDFFALGGHSLLATRLVHAVNQRMAAKLSLRDLFRNPVLADLVSEVERGDADAAAAFVFGRLDPDPANRYEPFPLTDIQEAYWVGRESTLELGGVAAHGYDEISVRELDEERFTRALNLLIARHDMLRAVFHGDGTQQVLETVPEYRMRREDLRGLDPAAAELRLADIRERMSHQVLDAGRWPLFEFAVTRLDAEVRLHVSQDSLIVDAASSQLLERELVELYADPDVDLPPLELNFRDYVLAERALRETPRYERALGYWRERAAELAPAPALPLARRPETVERPHFTRYDHIVPAARWSALKATAKQHGVTPSVVLLTAFSQVLALWSRQPRFTLSLPLFNRLPLHPGINHVLGDFTSLILLEVDVAGDDGFVTQARAVQERLWQDIDHSAVSGVRVSREVSKQRGSRQTAMPVVFNSTLSELAPGADDRSFAVALGGEAVHSITQTPQVWIDHSVWESEGSLYFNWDSIDELFPDGLVAEMFAAYHTLLESLADRTAWKSTVDSLLPGSRFLPVNEELPGRRPLLHELFDRQAQVAPEAPAVFSADRQLNYGELRDEARQLAGRLQAHGVQPGQLVAVMLDRGWEQVAATLAVLYAGAAYLPIDPELPPERVAHILERAGARLALVQSATVDIEALIVGRDTCGAGGPALRPVTQSENDVAYVIYTSGSTGTPKGVVIDHRGAVNTLLDVNERFGVKPEDRVLAISSLSFDLSVFDFFGTFAAGAAVVTLSPDLARDPAHWLELLHTHRVSVWNSVPALLGMMVEYAEGGYALPPSLRLAMLSGDWIPLTLPDRFRTVAPSARVDSLGGATEASIWSIHYPIGEVDPAWRSIPYGKALTHQQFHVLDDALRPRPVWVPGQLYIGGIGVALGYWRDDVRTAASFVIHPGTGERLYRTGDLGRLLPDGNIEFLGREDGQVKVNGYRVELGEIEAALEADPTVESAVVRLLGETHGEKRLAAYVVSQDGEADVVALAQHLGRKVPAYMVPTSFTFLDALPLSANGKVDKSKLPEPAAELERPGDARGEELVLTSPAETRLVEIVEGILDRYGIASRANLLQLGATSIDIVRMANALSSELGFRPKLAQLMRQPTLADLLGMYREQVVAADPEPVVVEDPEARKEFKARSRGRREFADDVPVVALPTPVDQDATRRYAEFRSVRQFADDPVPATTLAQLLDCLSARELDGKPKYLYGSAGGAYAVQTYVYVKPDRVSDVEGGAYYHDPHRHRLIALGQGRELSPDAYDYFVNRPVFEEAAFALFLVAELAAIEPLYGDESLGFCQLEAGAMGQLLTMTAPAHDLGLCGIGSLDTGQLEPLFDLGPTHRLVYSLVGGLRRPAGHDGEHIVGRQATDVVLPLSFSQRQLWFLDQLAPGNPFYSNPSAFAFTGELDVDALRRSLTEVVRRHEALRTVFESVDGEPRQVVRPAGPVELPVTDLAGLSDTERREQARLLTEADARTPFDLAAGPLVRASLLRLAAGEYRWLLNVHHIVADGWSTGILVQEVGEVYAAYVRGVESPLPELAVQYPDYSLWQQQLLQSGALESQLEYWTAQLADAPTLLSLPTDRPRPAVQRYDGDRHTVELSAEVLRGLHAVGQAGEATLFMTLMATLSVLLWRYSGQDDVCVGTPFANRNHTEVEGLIGHFINTAVIRNRLDGEQPFGELLQDVRREVLAAYAHPDLPFDHLVEALRPERHPSHSPLFQVMLVLQNMPLGSLELPGLALEPLETSAGAAKFDLAVEVLERDGGLDVLFEYNTDLFDASTIARLAEHYVRLLEQVAAEPSRQVGDLRLLGPAERRTELYERNDTASETSPATSVERFETQVRERPGQPALVCGGEELDYATVDRRANRLAHALIARGVGPEHLVGLHTRRSTDLVVGILGVLKAGAAYLPLDPALPPDRLTGMVDDAAPALVLSDVAMPPNGWDILAKVEVEGQRDDAPGARLEPGNLAYVIYTSGSTGRPKGVAVSHGSIANLLDHWLDRVGAKPGEAAALWSSFGFDVSVQELLLPLTSGGTLHVVPEDLRADPELLMAWLRTHGVVSAYLPPAFVKWLAEAPEERLAGLALRQLLVGVEPLPEQGLHRLREALPGLRILNGYGPTETSVYSTAYLDPEPLDRQCPIGQPLANTRVYLLDERLQPVPLGVAGELYLGGAGLARGYLGKPGLTAERFVPDPFVAGERVYRTGDLARRLPSGDLMYVGRRDHQVKLRGFRIELGEIEAVLLEQPGVREAAVLVDHDAAGEPRLVAGIGRDATEPRPLAEWRAALSQRLPGHMIPALFVELPRLPQTANGKLDRAALLREAGEGGAMQVNLASPRDHVELTLYQIWKKLLLQTDIGIRDSFFDVGGSSISAIKLAHAVREAFGVTLPIHELVLHPTIEALGGRLRQGGSERPPGNLLEFRKGDGYERVVCVHPAGGTAFCYLSLAKTLPESVGVYGIQSPGVNPGEDFLPTVEAMAEAYLDQIEPLLGGPLVLTGLSYGGLVAHEMGRRLALRGYSELSVVLLDTQGTDDPVERAEIEPVDLAEFRDKLIKFNGMYPGIDDRQIEQYFHIYNHNRLTMRDYLTPPTPGRLVLLEAIGGRDDVTTQEGRDFWGRRTEALVVETLTCDHWELLETDEVLRVAEVVRRELGRFPAREC